jgi:hypothetical protein
MKTPTQRRAERYTKAIGNTFGRRDLYASTAFICLMTALIVAGFESVGFGFLVLVVAWVFMRAALREQRRVDALLARALAAELKEAA